MGQSRTFESELGVDEQQRMQSLNQEEEDDDVQYVEEDRDEPEAQNLHVV